MDYKSVVSIPLEEHLTIPLFSPLILNLCLTVRTTHGRALARAEFLSGIFHILIFGFGCLRAYIHQLVLLIGLALIAFIGLLNLTLNSLMELLNLIRPFACLSAHSFLEWERSEVNWTKWIIAIHNLEWSLLGGAV